MREQEIAIGQSKTYQIAGRELILKPMSLGKMKRATLIFADKDQSHMDLVAKYLLVILDNGENKDLTLEWIEENITLPEATDMIDASRAMNGLGSFFQKAPSEPANPTESKVEERPINEVTPILSA